MTDEDKMIAARLGNAQKRVVLSLSENWGKSADHQAARRMFYGIKGGHYLVDHRHREDNWWRLTDKGSRVKAALLALAE